MSSSSNYSHSIKQALATHNSSQSRQNIYTKGDFALIEPEMNPVPKSIAKAGWNTTGIHNHMILESPKTTFMHWETTGNLESMTRLRTP